MNTSKMRVLVMVGLVVGSLCAGSATAAMVLDQESPYQNATFNVGVASLLWQQEVVVGITGTLARVELYTAHAGTTPFSINAGAPWQIDAGDFAAGFTGAAPGWTGVDTSAASLFFNAGDHFVIAVGGTSSELWLAGRYDLPAGGYPAGACWLNGEPHNDGGWDIGFRTYVEPAAVPVPAAFLMGLLGLGTAGWRLRRGTS